MLQIVATEVLSTPLYLLHVGVLAVGLALFAFASRHQGALPSRLFLAWLGCDCAWLGAHVAGLAMLHPLLRLLTDTVELSSVAFGGGIWVLFTLAYAGRWEGDWTRIALGVAGITGAVTAFVLTNPVHGWVFPPPDPVVEHGIVVSTGDSATAVWVVLAWVFSSYLTGVAVLLDLATRTEQLYRDQIVALLVAVLVPLTVAAGLMSGALEVVVDPTPSSFGVTAVALTYLVFRSEVLDAVPAKYTVGERTALESLEHGVLVRDQNDRLVFANETGRELLGDDPLGRTLEAALAESPLEPTVSWIDDREARRADGGPDSGEGVPETLRDTETGRIYRTFESSTPEGEPPVPARTLVLEDVTEERRRKQRLLVLNRIVRHNLRNEMTVLHGYVDELAEQADDDSVDVVADIARDLVHLGEKAHEMDRVIRETRSTDERVNVSGVVDRVVESFREESGAEVEVWGDVQAWTRTDAELLETIVYNLLEVAAAADAAAERDGRPRSGDARRADTASGSGGGQSAAVDRSTADEGAAPPDAAASEPPAIVVTVSAGDDGVHVSVENEGPGIPEEEVQSLLDGEVSALRHGASIGLWVVKWCVELADATWEVETGDWTRVTVTFRSEPDLQTTATGLAPE